MNAFRARRSRIRACIGEDFARQGIIMTYPVAEPTRVEPGLVVIELGWRPELARRTVTSTPGSPAPSPIPRAVLPTLVTTGQP